MGLQKLVHMEGGMLGKVVMRLADGAGFPRLTASASTRVRASVEIAKAGLEIVALIGERAYRAGVEAGPVHATGARACRRRCLQPRILIEKKRAAKGMPKTEDGMDGQADRRGKQASSPDCPLDEGPKRRPFEGVERPSICGQGDIIQDGFRPSIQRQLRLAMPRRRESRPDRRSNIANDGDYLGLNRCVWEENFIILERKMSKDRQAVSTQT